MKKTIISALLDKEKENPAEDFDTISNDNTDSVLANIESNSEDDKQIENSYGEEIYQISRVTPMTIMTSQSPNGQDIATLVFLCSDHYKNNTYTIVMNYYIENEEQKKAIENNPIHDNTNYISKRLASNMIMNTVPCFITDMNFFYNKDELNPNKKFYMYGIPNTKEFDNIARFEMSAEIFSSIAFIDDYVVSDCHNIHDLQIATVAGYTQSRMVVSINFVDTIDSIVSLAPVNEKESTDIAVVFKVLEFVNSDTKNVYKILSAFDFGKKYQRKKFRGKTIAALEEAYGQDIDQYISNYMIECRIKNLDKDYLIIKAKNKDGISKLFFIDNDNQKKIEELVEMY